VGVGAGAELIFKVAAGLPTVFLATLALVETKNRVKTAARLQFHRQRVALIFGLVGYSDFIRSLPGSVGP